MKNKEEAVKLLNKKINKQTYMSYDDISCITGYHKKYLIKLKKDIENNSITFEHGNKNKKPHNALSEEEIDKIKTLYLRSNASIRKFYKFYGKHSYSCIYNIVHNLEKNELKEKTK